MCNELTRDKEDFYWVNGWRVMKAYCRDDPAGVDYYSEWTFELGRNSGLSAIPDYNQRRFTKFLVPKEFME